MLLAVDIGNTQIAAGLFRGDELVAHWRLSSTYERTEDETWVIMQSICQAHGFDITETTGMAVSSVVPGMTRTFEKMASKYLKTSPVVVSHQIDLGIQILYKNPSNVGADRLCNAVGGFIKYGGPLIVVDFGTATTFDVISKNAEYLGGIIAPGIEMSSMILHQRAAKLPRVELSFPEHVIGNCTEDSMRSGLMYGTVEMIDGMIKRISNELQEKVTAIATGGLARVIIEKLETVEIIEPYLTLDGLLNIYKRVRH